MRHLLVFSIVFMLIGCDTDPPDKPEPTTTATPDHQLAVSNRQIAPFATATFGTVKKYTGSASLTRTPEWNDGLPIPGWLTQLEGIQVPLIGNRQSMTGTRQVALSVPNVGDLQYSLSVTANGNGSSVRLGDFIVSYGQPSKSIRESPLRLVFPIQIKVEHRVFSVDMVVE